MKTLQKLREDTVGIVQNVLNPAELRNIRDLSIKLSNAYQAGLVPALKRLEDELNKFGYSLGELDLEGDLGESGTGFLTVQTFATKETAKNIYFVVKWEKMDCGQQYAYRHDGSALDYRVDILCHEAAPEILQSIIDSQDQGYVYFDVS